VVKDPKTPRSGSRLQATLTENASTRSPSPGRGHSRSSSRSHSRSRSRSNSTASSPNDPISLSEQGLATSASSSVTRRRSPSNSGEHDVVAAAARQRSSTKARSNDKRRRRPNYTTLPGNMSIASLRLAADAAENEANQKAALHVDKARTSRSASSSSTRTKLLASPRDPRPRGGSESLTHYAETSAIGLVADEQFLQVKADALRSAAETGKPSAVQLYHEILNLVKELNMSQHLELFLGNRLTIERLAMCSRSDLLGAGFSENESNKLIATVNKLSQSAPNFSGSATVSLKKKKKRGGVRGFFRNRSRLPDADDDTVALSPSGSPLVASQQSNDSSTVAHKDEIAASLQHLLQRRPSHECIVNAGILLKSSIIGTSLDAMLSPGVQVPPVFQALTLGLRQCIGEEDLFDMELTDPKLHSFAERYDALSKMEIETSDPHLLAGLLRLVLDRLTDPLLGFSNFEKFLNTTQISESSYRTAVMRSLVYSLPPQNRASLQYLLSFCQALVKNKTGTIEYVSEKLGPVVLRKRVGSSSGSSILQVSSPGNPVPSKDAILPILAIQNSAQVFECLLRNHDALFLNQEPDVVFVMEHGKLLVSSASVERLIEKLVDPFYADPEFVSIFLATHRYFITSVDLLHELTKRFSAESVEPWAISQRLRILGFLRHWTNAQSQRLKDDQVFLRELSRFVMLTSKVPGLQSSELQLFSTLLKSFPDSKIGTIAREVSCELNLEDKSLLSTLQNSGGASLPKSPRKMVAAGVSPSRKLQRTQRLTNTELKRLLISTSPVEVPERRQDLESSRPKSARGEKKSLSTLKPRQVAEQLTLTEHAVFCAIPNDEFIQKAFMKAETSPVFTEMVNHFNRWSRWTMTSITSHSEALATRVSALARFIKIAYHCLMLQNFNTAYAITAALHDSCVQRLKLTWSRLPKKTRVLYDHLSDVFDIMENHKNYRLALQTALSSGNATVPYLGLYRKTLLTLEETTPTIDPHTELVNFHGKFRSIWRVLKEINRAQRVFYQLDPIPDVIAELTVRLNLMSVQDCYKQSLVCEPKSGSTKR